MVVVRSDPRTEVPARRNSRKESRKRSTAQTAAMGPSIARVDGLKGSGLTWFSAIPNRIADRKTRGGLSKPGNGPPFVGCWLSICRLASIILSFRLHLERSKAYSATSSRLEVKRETGGHNRGSAAFWRSCLDAALLRGERVDRLDWQAGSAPCVRSPRAGTAGADRPRAFRRLLA